MVEITSNSVDFLLFEDVTISLCRTSIMQHRKDLLRQTFGDWKLTLNDDKWEHIVAENDPEERKRQRKNGQHGTNAQCTPERFGYVSP